MLYPILGTIKMGGIWYAIREKNEGHWVLTLPKGKVVYKVAVKNGMPVGLPITLGDKLKNK